MVRAKFRVTSHELMGSDARNVKLNVVYSGGDKGENAKFFASTPSGEIRLGLTRPEVAQQLKIGEEFYVDFTPVPKESDDGTPA